MFKRQPNLKNYSALKSSDRRRFQSDVFNSYPAIKNFHSAENAPPFQAGDLQKAKFATHVDDLGILYSMDNTPAWFEVNDSKPIPTVYSMWKYPNALPTLSTWPFVISKLINGADLMIPGLVAGSEGLPDVKEGDLVAICIHGYKYPLAVGTMAIDTAKIKVRQGMKGKAVNLIHVYQDFLWALGDKSNPPEIDSIEELEGVDSDHDSEMEDASRQMENSHIAKQSTFTNQQTENENVQAETKEEKPALSTKGTWACLAVMTVMNLDTNFLSFRLDIDQLLKNTFYQALAFKLTKAHPPELLPMSASMLYSTYMLPNRPFVNGQEVDVKKSSWKKMQKFLKDMEKAGICKLKDRKGESHIVSINWNHEELTSAKPYKTLESKSSANNEKQPESSKAMASAATKDAKGQIVVQLYYKPKKTTVPLFEKQKKDIKQAYNAQEVRDVLMAYVDEENLIDPSEKRFIRIDPLLCDAILKKDEYNSINRLQRDQTLQRILDQMQHMHTITLPEQEPLLRDGNPRNIVILLETRQGRKTMTKITGIEWYGLSVDDACKDLTRRCASSVTANPIPGSSPKNPQQEIMVQGPQIKHVTEMLLSQGVPKKYIEVVDKTGKGKKK